jgi:hypothetical protein
LSIKKEKPTRREFSLVQPPGFGLQNWFSPNRMCAYPYVDTLPILERSPSNEIQVSCGVLRVQGPEGTFGELH